MGDAANLAWAMSASPLIVDEMVVVLPGGRDGWSVAAYDRLTGDIVWHVLDDVQGYTSPMLATIGGVRQILGVTADRPPTCTSMTAMSSGSTHGSCRTYRTWPSRS